MKIAGKYLRAYVKLAICNFYPCGCTWSCAFNRNALAIIVVLRLAINYCNIARYPCDSTALLYKYTLWPLASTATVQRGHKHCTVCDLLHSERRYGRSPAAVNYNYHKPFCTQYLEQCGVY